VSLRSLLFFVRHAACDRNGDRGGAALGWEIDKKEAEEPRSQSPFQAAACSERQPAECRVKPGLVGGPELASALRSR